MTFLPYTFLPYVEKTIAEAKKKHTKTVDQLEYIFSKEGNVCIKKAKELTTEEINNWASFFRLKQIPIPKRAEQKNVSYPKNYGIIKDTLVVQEKRIRRNQTL